MSRLQDELAKRQGARTLPEAEQAIRDKFESRVASLQGLMKNKDFKEYLKLEEEMNDPKIVIAYECTDPVCLSLKRKIRDFWTRQKVLAKVMTNGSESGAQRRQSP